MAAAEKAMDIESGQNEAHEGDIPSDEEGGKVNCHIFFSDPAYRYVPLV